MIYVGIDPGMTGAIAFIRYQENDVYGFSFRDCPVVAKQISAMALYSFLAAIREMGSVQMVGIERAQAMPKQGVVAMFNYGVGYGLYIGILTALKLPYMEIRPTEWKKEFGLLKQDKSMSILRAGQLFPDAREHFVLKKHHGRAEALLIAEYVRRKTSPKGDKNATDI